MSKLTDSKRENSFHTQNCDEAQFRIEIAKEPKPNETEFIVQQVLKFNSRCIGEKGYKPLTIFLQDTNEKLVGRLIGAT